MPLPSRYVDEIHARLAVRYGARWLSMWTGVDPEHVKADWADVLGGMQPANIRKALESLPPEFPPTAPAFRALGVIADEHKPAPQLPPPDPAGMKRIAGALGSVVNHQETPVEWMERLRRDVEAGNASRARKEDYRIAVTNGYYGGQTVAQVGDFKPIPRENWPEAMQQAAA
jgi:hypothetical protein